MEVNKILNADILDILFEGRNKEYGAYDLRKTYNRRLTKALIMVALLLLSLWLGYTLSNLRSGKKLVAPTSEVVDLMKIPDDPKNQPPPPPPPKTVPPKVATVDFTPPKIVRDQDVKPDEKPPEQDQLVDTRIGTVNVDGAKDEGITAPPVSDGKGVVEAPKDNTNYDQTFTKVEIESFYAAGDPQWRRYLGKNMHYPEEAIANEIQGTVVVQFIVDKEGNVSDAHAISGPIEGGLREEAVRVIMKSGRWTPAIQNGRQVKSYKSQPIVFQIGGNE